jgi:hypothetical protein
MRQDDWHRIEIRHKAIYLGQVGAGRRRWETFWSPDGRSWRRSWLVYARQVNVLVEIVIFIDKK